MMKMPVIVLAVLAAGGAIAQTTPTAPSAPSAPRSPQPGFSRPASTPRPCLSPVEARGLATFVLPGLVDELAKRCRGSLGRQAYLRGTSAGPLADRLRRDAEPSWPVAKAAIEKLNGERLPGLFGERFIMNVAEATAADLTLRDFDRKDCGAADDLVAALAPLPSANFSSAIAALIALGADAADADAPLRICAPLAPAPR